MLLDLIVFRQASPHQPLVDFYRPALTNKAMYICMHGLESRFRLPVKYVYHQFRKRTRSPLSPVILHCHNPNNDNNM